MRGDGLDDIEMKKQYESGVEQVKRSFSTLGIAKRQQRWSMALEGERWTLRSL